MWVIPKLTHNMAFFYTPTVSHYQIVITGTSSSWFSICSADMCLFCSSEQLLLFGSHLFITEPLNPLSSLSIISLFHIPVIPHDQELTPHPESEPDHSHRCSVREILRRGFILELPRSRANKTSRYSEAETMSLHLNLPSWSSIPPVPLIPWVYSSSLASSPLYSPQEPGTKVAVCLEVTMVDYSYLNKEPQQIGLNSLKISLCVALSLSPSSSYSSSLSPLKWLLLLGNSHWSPTSVRAKFKVHALRKSDVT